MRTIIQCPHCKGDKLYHQRVTAREGQFDLLPGIGEAFRYGEFDLYACADCGHLDFFVAEDQVEMIAENWDKVTTRLGRHE